MGTGILVCGLNGSGKSTLGRVLADRLGYGFIDNEDLYFPGGGDYKFEVSRTRDEVEELLLERIVEYGSFIFTSVLGDYERARPFFDYAIQVMAPRNVRLSRIRQRSFGKFGARMLPGGDLYEREERFFELAASRPEDYVDSWLSALPRPVLRVDGTRPAGENTDIIVSWISSQGSF